MTADKEQACAPPLSEPEPAVQRKHPVRRYEHGQFDSVVDTVVSETRIEPDINQGQVRLAMLCLPKDVETLAVGFLMGEGILRGMDDLAGVQVRAERR